MGRSAIRAAVMPHFEAMTKSTHAANAEAPMAPCTRSQYSSVRFWMRLCEESGRLSRRLNNARVEAVESIAIERTRLKVHAANCLPAFSHSVGQKQPCKARPRESRKLPLTAGRHLIRRRRELCGTTLVGGPRQTDLDTVSPSVSVGLVR